MPVRRGGRLGAAIVLLLAAAGCQAAPGSEGIPKAALAAARQGEPVTLLVRIAEDAGLLSKGGQMAATSRRQVQRAIKERLEAAVAGDDFERLRRYDHLPMLAVSVRSADAIKRLAERDEVQEIYEDVRLYPILSQSLTLMGQTTAAARGQQGSGTAVAVLDTGVDYTRADFGSCTAPGLPATCKVAHAADFAPDDGALDANGHGTMVAAIAAGVAPQAKILALDVFDGSSASSVDVIEAIDWVIANQAVYGIVAINLSLGGSSKFTSPCTTGNVFRAPIQEARAAGIMAFVASGNNGYSDGISQPACTPEAESVGAVYDANVGTVTWSACADSATAADKVACFSNSASFLDLLAPGAMITVAGASGGGTSFAAPHAAGAYAVLRSARPAEAAETAVQRLSAYGVAVTDSRNGVTKPRIDLASALQFPTNDAFAAAVGIAGNSGSAGGSNVLATAESGEPAHAGASPNRSVWWQWTAPVGGDAVIRSNGSGFDTVLAAYTGTAVGGLSLVAQNNDENATLTSSRIAFRATAGTTYRIAAAGNGGATGSIALNWTLTEPVADLAVNITDAPDPAVAGADVTYTATVTNNGPNVAETVILAFTVPGDAIVRSASSGCTVAVGTVTCGLGTMAVGQSLAREVVLATSAAGNLVVSANADGAWGDPVAGNETVAAATAVVPASEEDVPLPAWSLVLLASLLGGGVLRRRQGRSG